MGQTNLAEGLRALSEKKSAESSGQSFRGRRLVAKQGTPEKWKLPGSRCRAVSAAFRPGFAAVASMVAVEFHGCVFLNHERHETHEMWEGIAGEFFNHEWTRIYTNGQAVFCFGWVWMGGSVFLTTKDTKHTKGGWGLGEFFNHEWTRVHASYRAWGLGGRSWRVDGKI